MDFLKDLIDKFLEEKTLFIVLGSPGSGKSTFIANYFKKYDINELNGDIHGHGNVYELCNEYSKDQKSTIHETVGSRNSTLIKLDIFRSNGFKIFIINLNADLDIVKERVKKRVLTEYQVDLSDKEELLEKLFNENKNSTDLIKNLGEYDIFIDLENNDDLKLIEIYNKEKL